MAVIPTKAVGNLSAYASNQLVGNQVGFSWRNVAASAISAGITAKVAPALTGSLDPTNSTAQFQAGLVRGITGGVVSAHVQQGLVGGGVLYQHRAMPASATTRPAACAAIGTRRCTTRRAVACPPMRVTPSPTATATWGATALQQRTAATASSKPATSVRSTARVRSQKRAY